MAKVTLTDLTSLANDTSATNSINTNFQAIEDYINNQSLSRNADGEVNLVLNDIDFNGYDIQNLGDLDVGGSSINTLVGNAATSASNAATSESNAAASASAASSSASAASGSASSAATEVTYAAEWADKAEDSLISVSAGGDGSTDYSAKHWAAKALENAQTASVNLDVTNTFTATQAAHTYTASVSGNVTLDMSEYNNFVLTLTGDVTLDNPGDEVVGASGFICFIQGGTGSYTVTLGTDFETPSAAGVTLTAAVSSTDIVPYIVVASNRILLGTPLLNFS